ncbi:hypothetical protein GCM10009828_090770 [Actinoplanes couchii]|uniref:Uncharacterized protein n=1 Tax=Actinoplanes couchii TaxID=403638 RepID=A0ABQ3XH82_9ACTN|nr:hypothetical protein Aco03nite_062660 [Actinoplanes couchii]
MSRVTREVALVHVADPLPALPFAYLGVRGLTSRKIGTPERRTSTRLWSRTI